MNVLEVLVDAIDAGPRVIGLSAGYEAGTWRAAELASEMADHLPSFALSHREQHQFNSDTGMQLLRRAAQLFYDTDKYDKRGEFGELLLHMVVRQLFGTIPAVSKMFFKDSANDTVKGFDRVHIVAVEDDLELWLGEVKFYSDLSSAMTDVLAELKKHSERSYLRSEFIAITNKIEDAFLHAERLRSVLHQNRSLDEVFPRIRVPVLLTYDSSVIAAHVTRDDPYVAAFCQEINEAAARFKSRLEGQLLVHLILVPLLSKQALVDSLHSKLRAWQQI